MAASADAIIQTARTALGTPYRWGGNNLTRGVDCSGLVQQAFAAHGIQLPRVTYQQINVGSSVPLNKLTAGDLVFFDTDRKKVGPDHVGIYIGGGKFIHAPRTGDVVKISSLGDSYYSDRFMAGRRVSGVSGGGAGSVSGGGADSAPAPILEATELAERYGMSYAFFDSQPELKGLLREATAGQWTATRFQASLKNTKWWRESSKTSREAQVLAASDPASYRASMEAQREALRAAAVQAGAILTGTQLNELARNVVHFGWNEAQINNFLGKYIDFTDKHTLGGMAGTAAKEITGLAYELGIKVSEQQVKNYAQYIIRGVSTMEEVQTTLRQQATGTYPGFTRQIEAGESVRDLASPYIQMMAEELELPDTDVDLYTPQIRDAINRMGSSGGPTPMTLADFQQTLRNDPRWGKTQTAQDNAMAVGQQVLADMGLIARQA
ncbi:C40 family peptidase [Streptomyces johnsoniae]|uniref:C40 family peptidase n=1 Tax=Streptomyces johnsoniae TaxID=3075532 RepID=A0ABU2RZY4_9ACTN|nr:C40 family peptidase [Streptomyces sp. DSM 41886]MDT0442316.1 C40 family peptidase [Streptomyces sp. DSM 41886]